MAVMRANEFQFRSNKHGYSVFSGTKMQIANRRPMRVASFVIAPVAKMMRELPGLNEIAEKVLGGRSLNEADKTVLFRFYEACQEYIRGGAEMAVGSQYKEGCLASGSQDEIFLGE